VLVHQGSVEQGEELLAKRWPDAVAVADPGLKLYSALSIRRGRWSEVLSPRAWGPAIRAMLKGHVVGVPVGDTRVFPGIFLVHGDRVLWRHDFAHTGDHPSEEQLVAAVEASLAQAR